MIPPAGMWRVLLRVIPDQTYIERVELRSTPKEVLLLLLLLFLLLLRTIFPHAVAQRHRHISG